jgi:acyl-CoA synthetase (NDP forming)/GNAT superfamily N-acetyltransferase
MTTMESVNCDALSTTGRSVHLRSAEAGDRAGLLALNAQASDRSIYLRFFAVSRTAADRYVDLLLRSPGPDHHAVVAETGGRVIGVASFERTGDDEAEVGLLVADDHQHEGIGTLLLEQLAAIARHADLRYFTAEVMTENSLMLQAFRQLGLKCSIKIEAGVSLVRLDLDPTPELMRAMDARDGHAEEASLRPLLEPASIVVVGAGQAEHGVGHQVLRNILAGGFTGRVHVLNPHRSSVLGIPAFATAADLPEVPDLAVVAVPAAQVVEVVEDCGAHGVRAVIVLSSGFGETGPDGLAEQRRLLEAVRRHGMRLVGPNCLGVLNTDPRVRLNATFAKLADSSGGLALVSQSGALGAALVQSAQRSGLGISHFVSTGNKADVSGNDLLMYFDRDERTKVIGLYLESFGNPAKFARIARRIALRKPVLAIKSGRSEAGRRAGRSHTAAAISDDSLVDALFARAGVLRVAGMQELLDAAIALCDQPVPAGPRVGIVGNSGGPEILAADAAEQAGLQVVELSDELRAEILRAAPSAASTQNPADLGAAVQPDAVEAAVIAVLASAEVDSVLAVFTETLAADRDQLIEALSRAAATADKPVLLVQVGEPTRVLRQPGRDRPLPVYGYPERAATALGLGWRYASYVAPAGSPGSRPADVDVEGARRLVTDWLADGVGWLEPARANLLLQAYGIPLCRQEIVDSADDAVHAATHLGGPVAMKVADATVHKTETGGVRLDLRTEAEVREAYAYLARASTRVLVQPMLTAATEMIIGGMQDAQFGPVVLVGAGGIFADLLKDRVVDLAPVSEQDALHLLTRLRVSSMLDGFRGRPAASRPRLADVAARLSWLMADLPEVAEFDLNPVVATGDQVLVVDAKARLRPAPPRAEQAVRSLRSMPSAPPG